jgi:dUTPase
MSSESDALHHFVRFRRQPPKKRPIVKLIEHALTPKGSLKAANFNLRSGYDAIVPTRGKELIFTDLQIQLPERCYSQIASRSRQALWDCVLKNEYAD